MPIGDLNTPKIIFTDIQNKLPKHPTLKWKKRSLPPSKIVVHTTASDNQDPFKTATFHITPGPQNTLSPGGAAGLAYHDYITKDGVIYHCNDYMDITWHAKLWNSKAIGIVLAYRGKKEDSPTKPQFDSLMENLAYLCLYFHIPPQEVFGHRELPWMVTILGNGSKAYKKECPGMSIDLDQLRFNLSKDLQKRLKAIGLYKDSIDGNFGPKSKEALSQFSINKIYSDIIRPNK